MQSGMTTWRARDGRGTDFTLWDDALGDVLPSLGLRRDDIYASPPTRPTGDSLTVESLQLWKDAIAQYQREGTELFDAVRPSLLLDGPYAMQDIRHIATMKRDGIRDGRALVRWALSFADRSSLEGQMQLAEEINAAKLSANASLYELSEHLFGLWDLWLALSNSDRTSPASFFRHLLVSMPTEPECPVVHTRRWLVDLLEKGESALLRDLDGEEGLFRKMVKYGKSLGMKELPSLVAVLRDGARPGGGHDQDADKPNNPCCNAFACPGPGKAPDGLCICKATSTFDLSKIKNRARRDFVKMMRKYNALFPDKSLKVGLRLVRAAVKDSSDGSKDDSANPKPAVNFMASIATVMGEEVSDEEAIDAWLAANDTEEAAFFVMGDVTGDGDLSLEVVEEGTDDATLASSSNTIAEADMASLSSSTSSGAARAESERDREILRLRAELEVAQLRNKDLAEQTDASREPAVPQTPRPPTSQAESQTPNPALDRPVSLSINMTPRQLFARWEAATTPRRAASSSTRGGSCSRRVASVREEPSEDAPSGGASRDECTATENFARGIVKMEQEKRKLRAKSGKLTLASALRAGARLIVASGGNAKSIALRFADWCGDLSLHQLLTLALLMYTLGGAVKPVLKLALARASSYVMRLSLARLQSSMSSARALLVSLVTSATTQALTSALRRLPPASSPSVPPPLPAPVAPAAPPDTSTPTGQPPPAPAVPAGTAAQVQPPPPAEPRRAYNPSALEADAQPVLMAADGSKLSNAVLLASLELKQDTDGLLPALMDNGASKGTSCSRTLDGAIPGTLRLSDRGDISLGSDGAVLASHGSYLYALRRFATNDSEVVVRRMKHTPNLPMAMVFSEASENAEHGYGIYWPPGEKRALHTPDGKRLELFMSTSQLGWMKVKPIQDPQEVRDALTAKAKPLSLPPPTSIAPVTTLATLDPGATRSVGMGTAKPLKGVALLRRRHSIDGHPALAVTVKNLRLEGAFSKGLVTLKDVDLFASQGCGTCELTKMRRRAFSIKVTPADRSSPRIGAVWVFDVLELLVPAEHTGYPFAYVAVDKASKFKLGAGLPSYAEDSVKGVLNELRARVRPIHGEIEVLRMDSHPTHKSKSVRDYTREVQMLRQLSPPFVHEGVGDAEVFFLHGVPSANSLLAATPHLGQNHFTQALRYVMVAQNHSITSTSSPPTSPAMVYYGSSEFISSGLHVFGAEAKALVHGEARSTKFDDHAKACVYVGPPVNSDSRAHCAIWHKREYTDVDLGCINVNEELVIDRTRRDNVCTQPFSQVAATKPVDIGKPASIFDLSGMDYTDDELPRVLPIVWVRDMPTPTQYFAVLMHHGEPRPGDMMSWLHELSGAKLLTLPIDLLIGGHEHNTSRAPIKKALLELVVHSSCVGLFLQQMCKGFSAARFKQPGPPVLFSTECPEYRDGIPDEDGELPEETQMVLNETLFVAALFRAAAVGDRVVIMEFPASQGTGSPFAARGREDHSTVADTTVMRKLIADLGLDMIHTEQGAAGADSRKPTTLLCTPNAAAALRRTVGVLFSPVPGKSIVGLNEDGSFATSGSERYTAKFAMLLSIAFLASMKAIMTAAGELHDAPAHPPATDDLYPIGTTVEVWWYADKKWYKGTVVDSRVRKGQVHGASISRREIHVRYHEDDQKLWHALCDYSIREVPDETELEDQLTVLSLLNDRRDITSADDSRLLMSLSQPSAGLVPARSPADLDALKSKLEPYAGELLVARQTLLDVETGDLHNSTLMLAVLDDSSVVQVDYSGAHGWHVPKNEREYNLSPQRALWRTAKELKMDNYRQLNNGKGMFDLVLESSVDKSKYTIYDTLWVYKIKFKDGGLTFDKLNPRWCLKGGGMDRELYKCFAEMMRHTSMKVMWGLKAEFFNELVDALFDLSDAFQATMTVDDQGKLKEGHEELYCRQAPGFVQRGPNGELLVCRIKCYMQGRIDATRGFDRKFTSILKSMAHFKPTLWDPKIMVYHNTKLSGSAAPIGEIIAESNNIVAEGRDSEPQQPPYGWGMLGQHVDDMQGLFTGAKGVENNRIISFVQGCIATGYACTLTGWHGKKMLGFDLTLDDSARTVSSSAQGSYEALRSKLLTTDSVKITPRHIVTEAVYESHPGAVPEVGDPSRDEYLSRQSLTRSVLGAGIWLGQTYPQIVSGINAMCSDMANPSDARLAQLRHMFMYLGDKPPGLTFGGPNVSSIINRGENILPFTSGIKAGYLHHFSDASINVTGGVIMFAGACIQPLSLRQHLQSPEAHTSEIVSAGTNVNAIVPINGLLQELNIRLGVPTPVFFDSKSTVFVASSDTAPKKSVWLTRRNKVITEAVELGELEPVHIDEYDMVADSFTKYIKSSVWIRHMHYLLNLPGDPPDCHPAGVPRAKLKPKRS